MRAWDFPKSFLAWTGRTSRGPSQGQFHQFILSFIHFVHDHPPRGAGYLHC